MRVDQKGGLPTDSAQGREHVEESWDHLVTIPWSDRSDDAARGVLGEPQEHEVVDEESERGHAAGGRGHLALDIIA